MPVNNKFLIFRLINAKGPVHIFLLKMSPHNKTDIFKTHAHILLTMDRIKGSICLQIEPSIVYISLNITTLTYPASTPL